MAAIADALMTWRQALLAGTVSTYREIQSRANFTVALLWMGTTGVLGRTLGMAVLGILTLALGRSSSESFTSVDPFTTILTGTLPSGIPGETGPAIPLLCIGLVLSGFVVDPIILLLLSSALFLSTILFGGHGRFDKQSYLLGSVAAPLNLIAHAVWPVPVLGPAAGMGLLVLGAFLTVRILMAVHGIPPGIAVLAIAVLILALTVPVACALGVGSLWWYFDFFA